MSFSLLLFVSVAALAEAPVEVYPQWGGADLRAGGEKNVCAKGDGLSPRPPTCFRSLDRSPGQEPCLQNSSIKSPNLFFVKSSYQETVNFSEQKEFLKSQRDLLKKKDKATEEAWTPQVRDIRGNAFRAQICQEMYCPVTDGNGHETLEPKPIPRGSIFKASSFETSDKREATFAWGRVVQVQDQYRPLMISSFAERIAKPLQQGRIPASKLKPALGAGSLLIFREGAPRQMGQSDPESISCQNGALSLDLKNIRSLKVVSEGGRPQLLQCPSTNPMERGREDTFVTLEASDMAPKGVPGEGARVAFNVECMGYYPGVDILDAEEVAKASRLVNQINSILPNGAARLTVSEVKINDEGNIALPTRVIESDRKEINAYSATGYGDLFYTYNHDKRENGGDQYGRPETICSTYGLANAWKSKCEASLPTGGDPRFCKLQIGDIGFHSPAINGSKKDPTQHATHSSGQCVDFRLPNPTRFVSGAARDRSTLAMTNEFIQFAHSIGAVDILHEGKNLTADSKLVCHHAPDHRDHVHLCFPTPEAFQSGVHTSTVGQGQVKIAPSAKSGPLAHCYSPI